MRSPHPLIDVAVMLVAPFLTGLPIAPTIFNSTLTSRIFGFVTATLVTSSLLSFYVADFSLLEASRFAAPIVQFLFISAAFAIFFRVTGRAPISALVWLHRWGHGPDKLLFAVTFLVPFFSSVAILERIDR